MFTHLPVAFGHWMPVMLVTKGVLGMVYLIPLLDLALYSSADVCHIDVQVHVFPPDAGPVLQNECSKKTE